MQARLPWFMEARPSAACAKGGAGAYSDALQRDADDPGGVAGLQRGVIAASAFRTSYVPLSRQTDFIDGFKVGGARASTAQAATCLAHNRAELSSMPRCQEPTVHFVSCLPILSVALETNAAYVEHTWLWLV